MIKYKKLPLVVDAFRLGYDDMPGWASDNKFIEITKHGGKIHCIIHTLEGDMSAYKGDYIIKGVDGELYPCAHHIFLKTYEKVGDE